MQEIPENENNLTPPKILPDILNKEKCYGKFPTRKNADTCPLRKQCEIGKMCENASNEDAEHKNYHRYRFISIGNMFSEVNESRVDSHRRLYNSSNPEKKDMNEILADEEEAIKEVAEKSSEKQENFLTHLGDIKIPSEEAYNCVKNVVEKIVEFSEKKPFAWECLKKMIFQNKKQSQIARELGVSRQAVSKRLNRSMQNNGNAVSTSVSTSVSMSEYDTLSGKNIKKIARLNTVFAKVSVKDLVVYQYFKTHPGVSVTMASKKLSVSRKTIYFAIHRLEKFGLHVEFSPFTRKEKHGKSQKKSGK
jgi:biotin operon repressor